MEGERNPTVELLKLLHEFSQGWLWIAVRRHVRERTAWLGKAGPTPTEPGPAEGDLAAQRRRSVSQGHAESYRLMVQQRAIEYQRAAELLWEVAPELGGQLPVVDFFAVTDAESQQVAAAVGALYNAIRERSA